MRKKGIIVHCSDSDFGSSIEIDKWHRERGWDNVGYHFVICNGKVENNTYMSCMDGTIERGRDIDKNGAHASGYNDYIGICLIGKTHFTYAQMASLSKLIKELLPKYKIDYRDVKGHNQVSHKSCPNFSVEEFMDKLLSGQM